jgi:methionine-S-sulfoxide reductase
MDPTAKDHQGNDYGTQYRSGIYFLTNEQKAIALKSKAKIQEKYAAEIATEVLPAQHFWPAEDYHQHYLAKLGQSHEKGVCTAIRCYG